MKVLKNTILAAVFVLPTAAIAQQSSLLLTPNGQINFGSGNPGGLVYSTGNSSGQQIFANGSVQFRHGGSNPLLDVQPGQIFQTAPTHTEMARNKNPDSPPTSTQQTYVYNEEENANIGGQNFYSPYLVQHKRLPGASGYRSVGSFLSTSQGGNATEQNTALTSAMTIDTGAGVAFGGADYAVIGVNANGGAGTAAIGREIDTDVRKPTVEGKKALQLIDASSSTGRGTTEDFGLMIARQNGGRGYDNAINIGTGYSASDFGVAVGGTIFNTSSTSQQLRAGIDFSKISSQYTDAAIKLKPGDVVKWGNTGEGGRITSATAANAMQILFGGDLMAFRNFAGNADYLSISADGARANGFISPQQTPAAGSACTIGKIVADATNIYVCTAANTWRKAQLSPL